MNCLDCTDSTVTTVAVAVCHSCGAGVCKDHAVVLDHYLTRTEPIDQVIRIEQPARLIWCGACPPPSAAAHHDPHRHHSNTSVSCHLRSHPHLSQRCPTTPGGCHPAARVGQRTPPTRAPLLHGQHIEHPGGVVPWLVTDQLVPPGFECHCRPSGAARCDAVTGPRPA